MDRWPRAARTAALLAAPALVAVAVVVLRTGGDPVRVSDPRVSGATADACRRLDAALPGRLGELERRRTAPERPGLAAYGDPAVVIRCGAALTGGYRAGDPLLAVNDVPWHAEEGPDAVVFTLPRALVNVEVTIPRDYPAELLSLLTDAVRQAQPL